MENVSRYYIVKEWDSEPSSSCFHEELTGSAIWPGHKLLQYSEYVYDKYADGTWHVIKDRMNGHWNGVLPTEEDLFMMIMTARPGKEFYY